MIYQGTFKSRENTKTYRVTIGKSGVTRTIVDPFDRDFKRYKDKILFDEDPVTISCERDEITQQIIIRQAEISLLANTDLSGTLFADTNRSIPVIIEQKQDNNYVGVFRGYVDPLQFNQGAVNPFESYTVHATDPLGALEELKIDSIKSLNRTSTPTIKALMTAIIAQTGCELDFSKWVDSPNKPNDDLVTNMDIFYGDTKDDYMTLYDTLLNLLIYQGATIYYNPATDKVYIMNMYVSTSTNIDLNLRQNAMDASTNLSMSDVYSQIKLKCEIDPIDEEIKMFDSNSLRSDYPSYQKYLTSLMSEGEGRSAQRGMRDLLRSPDGEEASYTYESAYRNEYFCWVRKSDLWDFGPNGYDKLTPYQDQSDYLEKYLKNHRGHGMFVSFGDSGKQDKQDNSPIQNINMKNYLMIYVDGRTDNRNTPGSDIYTLMNLYKNNIPYICQYKGLTSVNLTPPDSSTTNYIIIDGKMLLNPVQQRTGVNWSGTNYNRSRNTYQNSRSAFLNNGDELYHRTVPQLEDFSSYYMHKFWSCTNPQDKTPIYYVKTLAPYDKNPPIPNMELSGNKALQYLYSDYVRDNKKDTISKLPILACELKIGDKYCCERLDKGIKGQNVFEWLTYEDATSHGIPTYFTIGIDPKIEDYIIGQEHDFSSTVDYKLNIDQKGMAIPINVKDNLRGIPEFKILHPINVIWQKSAFIPKNTLAYWISYIIEHGNYYYILELIESILISDLSINFVSNNGGIREGMTTADNDLVYCSNEMQMYINDSESDIKICTPLTMSECLTTGVKYQISNSYIYDSNNNPFYGWQYGSKTVKPEIMWVDYMYKQYSRPRKILSTYIKDTVFGNEQSVSNDMGNWMTNGTINGTLGTTDSYFNKGYVTKMIWDLKNKAIDISIREAENYSPIWE